MKAASLKMGKVYSNGGIVDDNVRKACDALVADETVRAIRKRLLDIKPDLEEHFRIPLSNECHGPDFVTYQPGGFFAPHKDVTENSPEEVRKRRVAMVIFLNSQSAQPAGDCFGGGGLTFYGLMDGPEWEKYGFTLDPVAGLLVAFRADVIHEVKPVTFGERHIIVFGFLAGPEPELDNSSSEPKIFSAEPGGREA
jgi:SM-20-related protein